MLLAAEAQDFAGIWRTGSYAEDPGVAAELGLSDTEQIIGFLYFGSRDGLPKPLPERKVDNYVSYWTA
jgi:nitroreductase